MIPVTNLRPFTRMLMTIGQIPTSYLISMSYEEQLLWLCNYLEKEVIPALNNNAEAVKEVQELFTELKSYVDNYFDNLDVQEEINNKLDEMAESGQLADIIAQYLGLAGVLAFDTISDIANATNITEGSICRTLGETTYNDGKGAFYKVRTITSGDIVDGVNIVALSVSNTLIAEKIPDYQLNINTQAIEELQNITTQNTSKINNINKGYKGIMCISKDLQRGDDHYLYFSDDGINFFQVGEKIENMTSDSSALYKIKDYYYLGNNTYQYSTDLKNWSEPIIIAENQNTNIWGSSLYYDEENETIYIYSSYRYNENTFTNAVGNESYYFKIIVQTATINEDGSLNINQTLNDILYTSNESYIDPYVIKHETLGYMLACKNESTAQIELYSLLSPTSINAKIRTMGAIGVEAPQLIIDGANNIIMYCHDYAMSNNYRTGDLNINIQTYNVVQISYNNTILPNERLGLKICNTPITFRHAGMCMCDEYDYQKILEQGVKVSMLANTSRYYTSLNGCFRVSVNSGTHNIINYPNTLYQFGGGVSTNIVANVCAYFSEEPLKISVGNTKITWTGNVATYVRNKTLTNNTSTGTDNIQYTLQPPSENLDYGFLAPYNGS